MSDGRSGSDARDLHKATGGLFLVRLWPEGGTDSSEEWGGRLLHVTSGKAHSFHDWPELINLLVGHLHQGFDQKGDETHKSLAPQPP